MSDPTNALELFMAMQEGPVIARDDAREAILIHDEDLPHVNLPAIATGRFKPKFVDCAE
jgi:hypothetical protein